MKKLLLLVALLLIVTGCKKEAAEKEEWDSNQTLIIASKKVIGWIPNIEHQEVDSLYATKNNITDDTWKAFSSKIEGFNYEPGYEYILEINVHHVRVLQEGEILIYYQLYQAKDVKSKKKKESQNLPADFFYNHPPVQ